MRRRRVHSTLVGVDAIVKRPYKVVVEVRRSSNGYTATLVSRDPKPLAAVVSRLKRVGYDDYSVGYSYGYVRVRFRALEYDEILFLEKIVYDALQDLGRGLGRRKTEILLAA